ncbi:TauD/TfdA family dioxygenase [Candidatus Gracilibacteria bacterium]|nr:TauD/TfdA family dioxygenase [Candidatus Gracilibacteria bacterium]
MSNNFVILKLDSDEYFKNNILSELSKIFGKMIEQTPAKDSIVYNIESSRSNKTSTKNNTYQPLHSDGNFKPNPPKIIALQCLQHSELGGYTKLVYARKIYNFVKDTSPSELENLFDINGIKFYRKDRNSKKLKIIEYNKPIFYRLENNRFGISFNPMMSRIESTKEIEDIYREISKFASEPKNQLTFQLRKDEILIVDNFSLLHARTEFPEDGGRLLRRAWYDGESNYDLNLGFLP